MTKKIRCSGCSVYGNTIYYFVGNETFSCRMETRNTQPPFLLEQEEKIEFHDRFSKLEEHDRRKLFPSCSLRISGGNSHGLYLLEGGYESYVRFRDLQREVLGKRKPKFISTLEQYGCSVWLHEKTELFLGLSSLPDFFIKAGRKKVRVSGELFLRQRKNNTWALLSTGR